MHALGYRGTNKVSESSRDTRSSYFLVLNFLQSYTSFAELPESYCKIVDSAMCSMS